MSENALKNGEKTQIGKPFQKGNPGGPGRPKGSGYMSELKQAIKEVGVEKKKPFFKRVVERAYTSDSVMIAVLRKFVPDKLKQEFEGLEGIKFEVEILNGNKDSKDK